jgi:hypothetical protein
VPDIPGLPADVYFGATDKPLPEWAVPDPAADEAAEDRPLTDDERAALAGVLGFDPAELWPDDAAAPPGGGGEP